MSFRVPDPRGDVVTRLELRGLRSDIALTLSTDAISEGLPCAALLLVLLCAPGATGLRGERVTPRWRLPVDAFSAAWPAWLDETPPSFAL